MKHKISILSILLFLTNWNFAQKPKFPFRMDAVSIGYLRTGHVFEESSKSGFGILGYRTLRDHKTWQIVAGIGYNYMPAESAFVHDSHFSYYKDVRFKLHFLSFNLANRFVFGTKTKHFVEFGYSLEPVIMNFNTATYVEFYPYSDYKSYPVKNKVSLAGAVHGPSIAIGMLYPIKNNWLLLKFEYRNCSKMQDYSEGIISSHIRISLGYEW